MKILVADFLEEPGHVCFTRAILDSLALQHEVWFASTPSYHKKVGWPNRISIPAPISGPTTPLSFRINQFCQNLKLLIWRRTGFDSVLFTGYETISMAAASWWFPATRCYLFDHNNIDQTLHSKVKRLFFRSIRRQFEHLTFGGYIAEFLQNQMGVKAHDIPHPYYVNPGEVGPPNRTWPQNKILIFSPSRSTSLEALAELLARLDTLGRFQLISRDMAQTIPEGLEAVLEPYFSDYEQLIKAADYVFVGGGFEYRVSGVLYESLALNTRVIVSDCRFGREIAKVWPDLVELVSDFESGKATKKSSGQDSTDFRSKHGKEAILTALDAALFPRSPFLPTAKS